MAIKVAMPKLGLIMTEGVVVEWKVEDGQPVKKGQPVAVIMSKKITHEVLAPGDGILRYVAKIKETIPVTEAIAYLTAPGEALPTGETAASMEAPPELATEAAPAGAPVGVEKQFVIASPAARRVARELGIDLVQVKGTGPEGKISETDVRNYWEAINKVVEVPATSMAKKLASQHGLDLSKITGTGSGGRVTEEDVEAYLAAQMQPAQVVPPGVRKVIPFAGMRQAIAQQMAYSLQSMAQVTAHTEVDVTEMVKMRQQIKKKFEVTYTDIIIKAVTLALQEHPLLNATQVGDEIYLLEEINIGVAVALEDGLIVPVLRCADQKTLAEINQEVKALAEAARSGTLGVDQVTGGTFTITNLGMYGIDLSTPVINPPEVAILGIGRVIEKAAVFQGEFAKRSMLGLSLTFDHRIVDGAPASDFLRTLSGLLESPYLLFV